MKKRMLDVYVSFENKYYNAIRSIVDCYRVVNPIGLRYDSKGIFNSFIRVEENERYTSIRFKVRNGLNSDLLETTLDECVKNQIIAFWCYEDK